METLLIKAISIANVTYEGKTDIKGLPLFFNVMDVSSKLTSDDERIIAILRYVLKFGISVTELIKKGFSKQIVNTLLQLSKIEGENNRDLLQELHNYRENMTIPNWEDTLRKDITLTLKQIAENPIIAFDKGDILNAIKINDSQRSYSKYNYKDEEAVQSMLTGRLLCVKGTIYCSTEHTVEKIVECMRFINSSTIVKFFGGDDYNFLEKVDVPTLNILEDSLDNTDLLIIENPMDREDIELKLILDACKGNSNIRILFYCNYAARNENEHVFDYLDDEELKKVSNINFLY